MERTPNKRTTATNSASKARQRVLADPSGMKAEVAAIKRERILETATQLFLRHGYHGCTMDAIAQAIGVTKPFIYYQFRDKSEILAAICSHGAELSLSALDQAEALHDTATERMRWFCFRLAQVVVDRGHYLAVYLRETASLSEADRKTILKMRVEIDERITRLVTLGVESGEFEVADAAVAARAITVMISNSFQWHRKDRSDATDAFSTILSDIAMRTLLPSPKGAPASKAASNQTT